MTTGAWLTLLAGLVLVAGAVVSLRQNQLRMRILALVATLLLTGVLGWLVWFSSTTA